MDIAKKCKKCQVVHRPLCDDSCPGEAVVEKQSGSSANGQRSGPSGNIEIPAETYSDLTRRLQKLEERDREMSAYREKVKLAEELCKKYGGSGDKPTSSTDSETDDSSDSATDGYSNGHRQRRRARRHGARRSSKSRALKSSRLSHHRHLAKGETIKSFEKLMCTLLSLLKDLMENGEDITRFIKHLSVLADKAETRFYRIDSVVAYDKAVRQAAAVDGMDTLKNIDSTLVMKHLGYDAAVSGRRQGLGSVGLVKSKREGFCYKFNAGIPCDISKCQSDMSVEVVVMRAIFRPSEPKSKALSRQCPHQPSRKSDLPWDNVGGIRV